MPWRGVVPKGPSGLGWSLQAASAPRQAAPASEERGRAAALENGTQPNPVDVASSGNHVRQEEICIRAHGCLLRLLPEVIFVYDRLLL